MLPALQKSGQCSTVSKVSLPKCKYPNFVIRRGEGCPGKIPGWKPSRAGSGAGGGRLTKHIEMTPGIYIHGILIRCKIHIMHPLCKVYQCSGNYRLVDIDCSSEAIWYAKRNATTPTLFGWAFLHYFGTTAQNGPFLKKALTKCPFWEVISNFLYHKKQIKGDPFDFEVLKS